MLLLQVISYTKVMPKLSEKINERMGNCKKLMGIGILVSSLYFYRTILGVNISYHAIPVVDLG